MKPDPRPVPFCPRHSMACNGRTEDCTSTSQLPGDRPAIEDVVRAMLAINGLGGTSCTECYEKHNGRRREAKWMITKHQHGTLLYVCDECRGDRHAEEDNRAPHIRVL